MKITSKGIIDGIIADKYGKRGQDFVDGIPSLSLPFVIHDAPIATRSFAVVLKDDDAVPVAGFSWIHWLAANITSNMMPENASRTSTAFIQGMNSWNISYYGGMTPPNAPHRYDLHVYALNEELPLSNGFTLEELNIAMKGHILEEYVLTGIYNN